MEQDRNGQRHFKNQPQVNVVCMINGGHSTNPQKKLPPKITITFLS